MFGSVLTGTNDGDGDLDLLVDRGKATTLFTTAGLQIDAKKLLGVPVDVLTPSALPPKFRDEVIARTEPLSRIPSALKIGR